MRRISGQVLACALFLASACLAEDYQLAVPLGTYALSGALPVTITTDAGVTTGSFSLSLLLKGEVSGTLTLGGGAYTVTGKQSTSAKALAVSLSAESEPKKISFKGKLVGTAIVGKCVGSKDSPVPGSGTFSIDVSAAPSLSASATLSLSFDDKGGITGTGTWLSGSASESVAIKGKSSTGAVPKSGALTAAKSAKPATVSLALKGKNVSFSGKGVVLEGAYEVAWKSKSSGASAAGKDLRIRQKSFTPDGTILTAGSGVSAGKLSLAGGLESVFNPLSKSVSVLATGAVLSVDPATTQVTLNGSTVFSSLVKIRTTGIDLQLSLTSGQNTLAVTALDSSGMTLSGTFTLWAGSSSPVVKVLDENGAAAVDATVVAALGDDQSLSLSGKTGADGTVSFSNMPDRTIIYTAKASGNRQGVTAQVGSVTAVTVNLFAFNAASLIDNNDFADGTANGWTLGTAPATIIAHTETVGPVSAVHAASAVTAAALVDSDLQLATSGEGPQAMSRTFVIKPGTSAITVRYRFVTSEVPGGYFGSKYNDYFAVFIRTESGGGLVFEANTMNGLGLAAFDYASGATAWREATLPVTVTGDSCQVNLIVANVGDGLYNSYVIVDKITETKVDLAITEATRTLLEVNRFEVKTESSSAASNFKIEIRRATEAAWLTLATTQVLENHKQRVAGKFKLRGKATIGGVEYTSQEKDLEVRFPSFADISGDATVSAQCNTAWTNTKAAANAATRREEGFWILLDTNSGQEKYTFTATQTGPLVDNLTTASVDPGAKPADNPAAPTPLEAAIYQVAVFHTHTPTFHRTVGRGVGPSATDNNVITNTWKTVGLVYDYDGDASGDAPAAWPLNSPAHIYATGVDRRATP
jgi:hypothetical protein